MLLGIICQGSDTSKVCFWDNQRVDPDGIKRSEGFNQVVMSMSCVLLYFPL